LVIQELLVRHRARTVFVVCPASLQVKWQTEMQEKFGLEFRIVDTDYVKRLRRGRGIHANPWTSYPRLISSMDWMKSGEGFRLLKDVLPQHITYPRKFDILVVDEAHNVAPTAASMYALESQRTRLIRSLAPHFAHRLFLSATPHNGYQESFTSLLELLDDQRFARTVMPDEKQLHRVMVRRLKSDIVDANGKPVFPVRKLEGLEVDAVVVREGRDGRMHQTCSKHRHRYRFLPNQDCTTRSATEQRSPARSPSGDEFAARPRPYLSGGCGEFAFYADPALDFRETPRGRGTAFYILV